MAANRTVSSASIGYTPIVNGRPASSFPRKCQNTTRSDTGTNARWGHAAHRTFGFPHTPRTHSFPHIG